MTGRREEEWKTLTVRVNRKTKEVGGRRVTGHNISFEVPGLLRMNRGAPSDDGAPIIIEDHKLLGIAEAGFLSSLSTASSKRDHSDRHRPVSCGMEWLFTNVPLSNQQHTSQMIRSTREKDRRAMLAVLPAELWSHIFQFVERGDRVAWLRVNRTANDLALKVMDFSDIDILTWSARRGYLRMVERLLLNPTVKTKGDAIHRAAQRGLLAIVDTLLLDGRCDPSHYNDAALRSAVVLRLLEDSRVNPEANANEALITSTARENVLIFRELLLHPKVDPRARDDHVMTQCCQKGLHQHLVYLLRHPTIDPNSPLQNGLPPMCLVAAAGHAESIRIFLRHPHIDVSTTGKICIDIATRKGFTEVEYLWERLHELMENQVVKVLKGDPRIHTSLWRRLKNKTKYNTNKSVEV
ncbi:ankyrin repeat domain-containing protein 44 [Planoprotostelium fungivorum]|uniref:Ankyrin repeat domain-containing protein 44 n=1 Tax=Planoprotostelium fungivorum TaxID=1890364 RepID=A0A2P6NMZ8_9EUKA|nr:ankyrin repeat domain-containing protein 44 [Planoprotostelium fungivorum]